MEAEHLMERPKCKAKAKGSGQGCKRPPVLGAAVCYIHGGAAPQVKAKAAARVRDMLAEAIDPDRSLREAARIAYSDIGELFDDAGRMLPIKQWPENIRRAVASMEVVRGNVDQGDGKFDDVVKIKLWDKGRNLESLMKHHGQLTERVEHHVTVDVVHRLAEARKRLNESNGG